MADFVDITAAATTYAVTLIAKWGKEKIELKDLSPHTSISQVKDMLYEQTNILQKRQKLIGLTTQSKVKVTDQILLSALKSKSKLKPSTSLCNDTDISKPVVKHNFILMGTAEQDIFIDPSDVAADDLPEVVDDFDFDFTAGSQEWLAHVATGMNLKRFTESTEINIIAEPRPGKPLMVLDLDHTLLDFSRKSIEQASTIERIAEVNRGAGQHRGSNTMTTQETIEEMKRPGMDLFLAKAYRSYDLVVWSQTSWRWLETKLIELGMLSNPSYRFCFVLDKTSMFAITSTSRSGKKVKHHVKPLQIIWNRFPQVWGPHNTVHLDDLSRNFALNPDNGLKVTAYYRKKKKSGSKDIQLIGLGKYLENLASEIKDFTTVKFKYWQDVVAGKVQLISSSLKEESGGADDCKKEGM